MLIKIEKYLPTDRFISNRNARVVGETGKFWWIILTL